MITLVHALAIAQLLTTDAHAYSFYRSRAQAPAPQTLQVEMIGGLVTSVPPGAQRVPMGTLRFTAPCGRDISVPSVDLWHRGLGAQDDIASVYAQSEGRRLTRGRQISSSDGRVQLRFRNFTVPACGTADVQILANYSQSASPTGEHMFYVLNADDVSALGVPVAVTAQQGNVRRIAGSSIGSIAVEYLNITEPIRYGAYRRVSRFRLEADNQDDHLLQSIMFTNNGSARNDNLQNLFIESSRGVRLTNIAPRMDGETVRLFFDPPFLLKKNSNQQFTLRADPRASRTRSIQFVIEEPGDITSKPVHIRSR